MFSKGGTLGQLLIVGRDRRKNGMLNRDGITTVQQVAELNIRQCQSAVGQIPLAGGGSDDPLEYGGGKVQRHVDFRPFSPFIDIRPGGMLRRPKIQRAIAAGQIT